MDKRRFVEDNREHTRLALTESRWDISLRSSSSTLLESLLSLNRYHDMNHDAAGLAVSGLTLDYGTDLSSLLRARDGR
jgi:hypothetical protein